MRNRLARYLMGARAWVLAFALVAGMLAGGGIFVRPTPAEAHCDSVGGPVVTAARQALEVGDVKLILPYVKADSEAELTTAFQRALEVRKPGDEAEELADWYFFETAVRLHRAGEGAAYTGLKSETDYGPALEAAEKALETGSLDEVQALLREAVDDGVARSYQAVVEAREREAKEGTVEAARERVEADLLFEKYVFGLHQAAEGSAAHGEGAPAEAGHTHGSAAETAEAHEAE